MAPNQKTLLAKVVALTWKIDVKQKTETETRSNHFVASRVVLPNLPFSWSGQNFREKNVPETKDLILFFWGKLVILLQFI